MKQDIQSLFAVSEVELVYRSQVKPDHRIKVIDSGDAYSVFIAAWDLNKIDLVEQFYMLLLNRASHCIGLSHIATGGMSTCLVDAKMVYATALKAKASSIVFAHNHPSGNLMPSRADILLTEKLVKAGQFLDLPVDDHLIITPLKYFSFADEGLIP